MEKFFTHKFLPVLAVILYLLFFFSITSFGAYGDNNVDTSTLSAEEVAYIKECTDYVADYCELNSITYETYFVITWGNNNDFMNGDTLAIVIGSSSLYFHPGNGGCLNSLGSVWGNFYFTKNTSPTLENFVLDSAYDHIRILYTNFDDGTYVRANENDSFFNGVAFSMQILDISYDYKFCQAISNDFPSSDFNRYQCYYSTNEVDWILMEKEESSVDGFTFLFYCNIYFDGTYYFKLHDTTSGLDYYDTKEVSGMFFQINVSETESTSEPILAYTNVFQYNGSGSDFVVEVSQDKNNWQLLDFEWVHWDEANMNESTFRRTTYIYENGTYYFRFSRIIENDEIEEFFYTLVIDNMLVDWNDPQFIPTPEIFVDYDESDSSFIIRTQYILQDKALSLKCLYTDMLENEEISTWNVMDYEIMSSGYTDYSEWYFYFKIPVIGAEDKTYKIAFYGYLVDKLGSVVTYEFNYEQVLDYVENELGKDLGFSVKFNTTLRWFKVRFGFLTYPFEFVSDVGSRILSIEFEEPVLNIPELREPVGDQKLLSAINYNFNSLLENDTFEFVHNIYLISVDFIIIVSLIGLAYKVIMGVFSK